MLHYCSIGEHRTFRNLSIDSIKSLYKKIKWLFTFHYALKKKGLNPSVFLSLDHKLWLYITINSPIWIILFFYFFHTVGFRSIFIFILSFLENKYQIHSYITSNMDDFKSICIYENLHISTYFFKRRVDFSCLLKKKNPNIFKYLSTCQTRTKYF